MCIYTYIKGSDKVYKVLTKCTVCNEELKITKLECNNCNTKIENDFLFSKFEKLNKEQLDFIEVLLSCRGNIIRRSC